MKAGKWKVSPLGALSLVGVAVFLSEFACLLLARDVLAPLLQLEVAHDTWDLVVALALTLTVAPALYFLVVRKWQASAIRFRQAAVAMLDAMIITDPQDRIIEWNPAAERMFQYTRHEALGQPLHRLISRSRCHAEVECRRAHFEQTGECLHVGKVVEILALRKDGSEFPAELSTSAARWDSGWHAIGVVRDLSDRRRAAEALQNRETQLALLHDHASCPLFLLGVEPDERLRFISVNRSFLETTGLMQDQIVGKCVDDIVPAPSQAFLHDRYREAVDSRRPVSWKASADYPAGWKTGVLTLAPVFNADGRCAQLVGTVLDVTERQVSERKILRQTQMYDALSQCNEAIVRCAGEYELFAEICRIAVETGAMTMAWIGLIDPGSRLPRPVASAGENVDEYLRGIEISADADSLFGHGPVGCSVRAGQPAWLEDFQHDLRTAPWHERSLRFGLRSVASLPLRKNGAILGVLVMYGASASSFDDATRKLLEQMAADISFALDNFAREAERRQAQAELRESEQRFRGLIEQSIASVYLIQGGKLIYVNPHMAGMLGYAGPEELFGRDPLDIVADTHRAIVAEKMRRRFDNDKVRLGFNFTAVRKDGSTFEAGVTYGRASLNGKRVFIGMVQDITEKMRVEELRGHYLAQLESAFMGTVQVATQLSEMRDPYTQGHARRVGMIASAIGAELGLDERQQQGLHVAGSLHDIGKISIPMEILTKLDPLKDNEWDLLRMHPHAGYDLLKGVNLPWPVAEVARQHHERMDGSGYPRGLRGDEILLEARVVMVADVVESMASRRPYRHELGIERALAEIERGRGSVYDPSVADACLRLFREQGYDFSE